MTTLLNSINHMFPRQILVACYSVRSNLIYEANRRCFSGKKHRNSRARREAENLPDFQSLLRALYKKVHPDLLRSNYPEQAAVNESSMQIMNGLLSTLKEVNSYPPQGVKQIPFYVRKSTGSLDFIEFTLKTTGGDCRKQITIY